MDISWIIFFASLFFYAVLFVVIPVRRKLTKNSCGTLIMKIAESALYKSIVILILALMLIIFSKLRDFKVISQIILALCGLLCEYLAINDFAFYRMSGVYTNGILVNGSFISYSTITCFPILQLPDNEQEKYDKSSLVISTTKKPSITLIFANEEECNEALKKIIEIKPELKNW